MQNLVYATDCICRIEEQLQIKMESENICDLALFTFALVFFLICYLEMSKIQSEKAPKRVWRVAVSESTGGAHRGLQASWLQLGQRKGNWREREGLRGGGREKEHCP